MRKVRAAAVAILLGTSILGVSAVLQPALSITVSAAVGAAINEAKSLAASRKFREAMDHLNSAPVKTSDERQAVDQMKRSIAVASGDASVGGALGAQAKLAADYDAGRWKEVIADGDALRKAGALDARTQLVIAQAYYQLHDSKNCMNYIRSNGLGGENALTLMQRCAYDANDDAAQRQALEQLVSSTGKPDHWKSLLRLAERSKGISDHLTLDILRLKAMTGTLDAAQNETSTYAQFALQMKMPAEAKALLTKAIADKSINADDRTNRLLKLATDRANDDAANFAKNLAAAQKAPQGDDLVLLGEDQIGMGKPTDGLATIQAGLAKGCKDAANCQLRLGTAYLAAGQKADAAKAFNAVKGDDKTMMVAHLYSLAARSGAATAPAAAPARRGKR